MYAQALHNTQTPHTEKYTRTYRHEHMRTNTHKWRKKLSPCRCEEKMQSSNPLTNTGNDESYFMRGLSI